VEQAICTTGVCNTLSYTNFVYLPAKFLVFDGTVLRVREINLSYTLPTKLVDKSPFKAVSLSFNAQNLWYKAFNFPPGINFDPEVSSGSGNGRGFDTQSDPTRRQFSLAIRLTL
jgi:hypothetical protein